MCESSDRRAPAALAVLLVLPLLAACEEAEPPAPTLRPVRWQEVSASAGPRARSFAGAARAGQETRLSFRVPGTVERLNAVVGRSVSAGQEIARLDEVDFRLRLQQAEAALAQAEAAERNARLTRERVEGLYENANASKGDLDQARAQDEAARAQVAAAANQVEQARRQLTYTRLDAPVAGALASVEVEEGENVGAGQVVALLAGGETTEVEVAVPETVIADIEPGDAVDALFDALPGQIFPAVVREVGVSTGRGSAYPVTARLQRADPAIRPGMAAELVFRFTDPEAPQRLVVPSVAVGEDGDGRYVFVLEPQADGRGVVRRRAVEIGGLDGEGIEITGGLEPGERLVTAGVRRLEDGQQVRTLDEGRAP